jgi:hypothetical protein
VTVKAHMDPYFTLIPTKLLILGWRLIQRVVYTGTYRHNWKQDKCINDNIFKQ